VDASINNVWSFYTNVDHLRVVSPPELKLRIIRCSTGDRIVQGTEVWLEGILLIKSVWHSKITFMDQYKYVDEMLEGRFRVWRHTHLFEQVSDDTATKIIDEIEYELHYGLIGKGFEWYVERQLASIFAHRKIATVKALK